MHVAAPAARLPADAAADIRYVRGVFVAMDDAVRPLVERGVLPQATYVLPDGTRRVEEEHVAWLSGEHGARLVRTTPEAIVSKTGLMAAITALLADPCEGDEEWRAAVRGAVDALDAIERPFARHDCERFGGPSSRDRLITATRKRFPGLWR